MFKQLLNDWPVIQDSFPQWPMLIGYAVVVVHMRLLNPLAQLLYPFNNIYVRVAASMSRVQAYAKTGIVHSVA